MQSGNHSNIQKQLTERAIKEEEKLKRRLRQEQQKQQQEEMTPQYNALFVCLKKVKSELQRTFNPHDCKYYETLFHDSTLIANFTSYYEKAVAFGLDVTELDDAIKTLKSLCEPLTLSIPELDTYIQDYIIDPVWNFQYHQVEHPGQKPLLGETTPPIESLPKEIANYVAELTRQPAMTVHLSRVNQPCYGLFKSEIGKIEAKDAAEYAIYPTQENVEIKNIIERMPRAVVTSGNR